MKKYGFEESFRPNITQNMYRDKLIENLNTPEKEDGINNIEHS